MFSRPQNMFYGSIEHVLRSIKHVLWCIEHVLWSAPVAVLAVGGFGAECALIAGGDPFWKRTLTGNEIDGTLPYVSGICHLIRC